MLVARVVHLERYLGLGRLGAWSSATTAALDGESCRRARVRVTPGWVSGWYGVCELWGANTDLNNSYAGLKEVAVVGHGGGATRSGGTPTLAWPGS